MFFFRRKKNKIIQPACRRGDPARRRADDSPPKFGRAVFYLLSFLFLGITVYIFIFSPFARVENYILYGTNELPPGDILEKIKNSCERKFLGFIPKDNFFLVSGKRISRELAAEFKKIKSVEVKKIFPQSVIINITERKSLIVWCSAGPCYILDEQGYAYTGTDLDSPEVVQNNLIKITDTGARPVILGEKVLNEEHIRHLVDLREEIKKSPIVEITSEWTTPSAVAEEVEILTQEGWKIFFSAKISPGKAIRTLKSFLEEEIDSEKRVKLEYADLRVENKVYYKIKTQEEEQKNPVKSTDADNGASKETEEQED